MVPSAGPILESDLVRTQALLDEPGAGENRAEAGAPPIDILNLSLGYYHETPEDELFDPTVCEILRDLWLLGTLVVCSAGNDATCRPIFPPASPPGRTAAARSRPTRKHRRSCRSEQ